MDLPTFRRLLAQHGAGLDAWPDNSGAAALELMASSGEARDAYLAAFPGPSDHARADGDDHALVERIMGAIGGDGG
jgi:hypothetical protein